MTVFGVEGVSATEEAFTMEGSMPDPSSLPSDRALIELTGDDRLEWLQGQATNDVRCLIPGSSLSFCFCEPTGQLVAVLDAWAFEDRILMATAHERAAAVLERIERMTILEDVVAREVASEPSKSVSDEAEARRIAAGVPKWGADMGPRTLPPELGPDFEARHVSYEKGCYTGQEVLMRMQSRGHTNRTWIGLIADAPLTAGERVLHEGKEVGRVSSASPYPLEVGFVAAAVLRNEATAEGVVVEVGGGKAEVRRMPIVPTF